VKLGSVFFGAATWLALSVTAFANTADHLNEAQKLLESNLHQQAYELLKSIENEAVGEASFDRMFAEAAAGIGDTSEAAVSLERLLHLDPSAVEARVELARIYSVLGNYEQAKFQLDRATNITTNSSLLQQAHVELKIVEEKLAKRRKRPVFDPKLTSRIETVQRADDADATPSIISAASPVDLQAQIAKAQSLLNGGQALAAYELLMKFEYEGSGNTAFDYLLGVAALEAGEPDKATLALERVLASDPNYSGARIDMGRAFMLLGDRVRAREEFIAVLGLNPSDKIRQIVDGFLAQMAQRSDGKKTTWTGFFGITLGRDSNVNNAPGEAEQFIPGILGTVVLDTNSVETSSNYSLIAGRIQVDHRISERGRLYAGMDLNLRRNFQAPQFDSTNSELRAGGVITLSDHEFDVSVTIGKTFLDPQPGRTDTFLEHPLYRNLLGGTAQWRFNVNDSNQLQTTAQYNQLRYLDDETSVFDSDQTVLGLNWFRAFNSDHESVGFMGAYLGKESDIKGNPSGEKDFFGVRVGGQYGLASNWAVFAVLGLMSADYQRFQVIHQKTREDKRYDFTLGMTYAMWQSWSLRPQLNLARQDSNISLYDFDRKEISVTLRRDWR
jgi:outer membrane protein